MPGPPPKPASLRQRANRKAGAAVMSIGGESAPAKKPAIPNPDGRKWHKLTLEEWARWWRSPMAGQWLDSDLGGLGVLILLHDEFFKRPDVETVKEIRLQRPCFGLTPLDRSRLQWEVNRADESEQQQQRRAEAPRRRAASGDPRNVLSMVPKKP